MKKLYMAESGVFWISTPPVGTIWHGSGILYHQIKIHWSKNVPSPRKFLRCQTHAKLILMLAVLMCHDEVGDDVGFWHFGDVFGDETLSWRNFVINFVTVVNFVNRHQLCHQLHNQNCHQLCHLLCHGTWRQHYTALLMRWAYLKNTTFSHVPFFHARCLQPYPECSAFSD